MADDDIELGDHGSVLRIHFGRGERPHVFWVGERQVQAVVPEAAVDRIKVLSKRRADGSVLVVVVDERTRSRRALARATLAPDAPSGALEHWVRGIGEALGIRLERYDLRDVATAEQWDVRARALGWRVP
jgi:hypothetical protein